MIISQKKLKNIMELSKFILNNAEIHKVKNDLLTIIDIFYQIKQSINLKDIEPIVSPLINFESIFREDLEIPNDNQELFKCIAPKFFKNYFIVPKVID